MGIFEISDLIDGINDEIYDANECYKLLGFVKDNGDAKYIILDTNRYGKYADILSRIKLVDSKQLIELVKNNKTIYDSLESFRDIVNKLYENRYIISKSSIHPDNLLIPIKMFTVLSEYAACACVDLNTMTAVLTTKVVTHDMNELKWILTEGYNDGTLNRLSCLYDTTNIERLMSASSAGCSGDLIDRVLKYDYIYRINKQRLLELVYSELGKYAVHNVPYSHICTGGDEVDESIYNRFRDRIAKLNSGSSNSVTLTHTLIFGDKGGLEKNPVTGKLEPAPKRIGFIGEIDNGEKIIIIPRVSDYTYLKSLNITNGTVFFTSGTHGGFKYPAIRLKSGKLPSIQIGIKTMNGWQLSPEWMYTDIVKFLEVE